MLIWLASFAAAGTIRVQAQTPVTYRLDGDVVGRLVTDITLTDIPEGAHSLRVEDTFGQIIASTDFILTDTPARFELLNRRLIPIDELVEKPRGPRPPITENQLDHIEHRMLRKRRDDKRLKRLQEQVNNYWFEMRHVDRLLLALETLEGRVQACRMLAPRTIDPEKTKAIEDLFPPGSYRERALSAFERYQRPKEEED